MSAGLKLVDLAFTVLEQELHGFLEMKQTPDVGLAVEYRLVLLGPGGLMSQPLGVVTGDYAREQAAKARRNPEVESVTVQSRVVLRGEWEREPRYTRHK